MLRLGIDRKLVLSQHSVGRSDDDADRKSSDEFIVPLCREHHRALHRAGNMRRRWTDVGIFPLERAQELWAESLSARNLRDASMLPPVP